MKTLPANISLIAKTLSIASAIFWLSSVELTLAETYVGSVINNNSTPNEPVVLGESISELSAAGEHFKALTKLYQSNEGELTLADKLGAAKSAWALGLVSTAREIWDEVLTDPDFRGPEHSRAALARSILELQEGNYDEARALSERAAPEVENSDLKSQFWLVVAEALKEQGALGQAENYYRRAVDTASDKNSSEAKFLLGEAQLRLGLTNEARYSFAGIESSSKFAPKALRKLAEIDLLQRNYDGVITWISEGRESFSEEFEDAWVGYAYLTSLLANDKIDDAQQELNRIRGRFSDENVWVSLSEAALESKLVESTNQDEAPKAKSVTKTSKDKSEASPE